MHLPTFFILTVFSLDLFYKYYIVFMVESFIQLFLSVACEFLKSLYPPNWILDATFLEYRCSINIYWALGSIPDSTGL